MKSVVGRQTPALHRLSMDKWLCFSLTLSKGGCTQL